MNSSNPQARESGRVALFIGSSTEGINIARSVRTQLEDTADVTLWNEGAFGLGGGTLEQLVEQLDSYDFAVLVLTPDDMNNSRGTAQHAPRDNVVFECGLFMARLGRKRTFLLYDREQQIKIPTDLAGTVHAVFRGSRSDGNMLAAVGPACDQIRQAISKEGRVRRFDGHASGARRVPEVLERGSSRFLDVVVDGAVYMADTSATFHEGLKRALLGRQLLPTKYLYCTDDGCEFWLDICRRPEYTFYSSSIFQLEQNASEIVAVIERVVGHVEIDLVSLGSGNGEKDNRLLRELALSLPSDGAVYYYPLDVNAQMLVQAVKGALNGVDRRKVRVKALIGDFTRLEQMIPVFEDRANANLFSVLGNTLGNSDEQRLLKSLDEAMQPGDLLLLEVNIQAGGIDTFLQDEINMRHDFVPLQSLGLVFDRSKMRYLQQKGISKVQGTTSTLSLYADAVVSGQLLRDIRLGVIHHYDPDKLTDYLQRWPGLEKLLEFRNEDVGLFLFRRPP